jgi:hypothetical protein
MTPLTRVDARYKIKANIKIALKWQVPNESRMARAPRGRHPDALASAPLSDPSLRDSNTCHRSR